jgi:predicted DNA-binding WGR domain protein
MSFTISYASVLMAYGRSNSAGKTHLRYFQCGASEMLMVAERN